MNTVEKPGARRQRGITMIAVVMILVLIAFAAIIAMRIIPIYLEYYNVAGALDDTQKELKATATPQQIINALDRRFNITYVTVVQGKDAKIRPKGANTEVEFNYEDRRPLIGNLDVVAKFQKVITLTP